MKGTEMLATAVAARLNAVVAHTFDDYRDAKIASPELDIDRIESGDVLICTDGSVARWQERFDNGWIAMTGEESAAIDRANRPCPAARAGCVRRVHDGPHADFNTTTRPEEDVAVITREGLPWYVTTVELLEEIERAAWDAKRATDRRAELVRAAMAVKGLSRDDIAESAGVTLARLYQIRDSRR